MRDSKEGQNNVKSGACGLRVLLKSVMDTLQTIKYAYLPIALFQVISREKWENMSDLQHKAVHRYIR